MRTIQLDSLIDAISLILVNQKVCSIEDSCLWILQVSLIALTYPLKREKDLDNSTNNDNI